MHFESAAKLYVEAGDTQMAHEAFAKLAVSSEKENSLLSAAEAYTQAASYSTDFESG